MSRSGRFRKQQSLLEGDGTTVGKPDRSRWKRRGAALTASGAVLVLGAGVAVVASGSLGSHASASGAQPAADTRQVQPAAPIQVLSVTPASDAKNVNGAAPIKVQFSAPLAASTPMPTLSPHIAGGWQVEGDTAVFTPVAGYTQNTRVTVTIPGGSGGMVSLDGASAGAGGLLAAGATGELHHRLIQHLAPAAAAQPARLPAADLDADVRNGHQPGRRQRRAFRRLLPARRDVQLAERLPVDPDGPVGAGSANILDVGAIRAFESVTGLTMDGLAGRTVWSDLLTAVAKGKDNPNGYTYALASQHSPETLTIWHDGHVVLRTPANTGIAASPTVDGTFPVYLKYYFSYMKGTNPDGSQYDDPVYYANYFNGGDAVHQFDPVQLRVVPEPGLRRAAV